MFYSVQASLLFGNHIKIKQVQTTVCKCIIQSGMIPIETQFDNKVILVTVILKTNKMISITFLFPLIGNRVDDFDNNDTSDEIDGDASD